MHMYIRNHRKRNFVSKGSIRMNTKYEQGDNCCFHISLVSVQEALDWLLLQTKGNTCQTLKMIHQGSSYILCCCVGVDALMLVEMRRQNREADKFSL